MGVIWVNWSLYTLESPAPLDHTGKCIKVFIYLLFVYLFISFSLSSGVKLITDYDVSGSKSYLLTIFLQSLKIIMI